MLNPSLNSEDDLASFKFLGILFGVAIRTKKPLDLHLAPCVWKLLVGVPLKAEDIEEVRVEVPAHTFFFFFCYLKFPYL